MKIAHLSDLHICTRHRIENLRKFEKLLQFAIDQDTDHFIITGDLSHNAYSEDFEAIRMILMKYDLLSSDRLSITIGNHDIFGGVYFADDIIEFPRKCRRTNLHNQVNHYSGYFEESFHQTERPLDQHYYPYAKQLGEVVLFGLNSIAPYSRLKNPFASNGRISAQEYDAVKLLLESQRFMGKRKIVMIHHHFTPKIIMQNHEKNGLWNWIESHTMKIYGRNKLINLFARTGVDLVLHGHVHINQRYELNGVKFLNGGATVGDQINGFLKLNMININPNDIEIRIEQIRSDVTPTTPVYVTEELIPRFAG